MATSMPNDSPPAFTPTHNVPVASQAQLQAAHNALQPGDYVVATAPFDVTGEFQFNKQLAGYAEFHLGGVRFLGDVKGSRLPAVWFNSCTNVRVYGIDVQGAGNDGIRLDSCVNTLVWDFLVHDTAGTGVLCRGITRTSDNVSLRGTITNCGRADIPGDAYYDPTLDPHNDKGTGNHAINIGTGTAFPVINSRFVITVHDQPVGAAVEVEDCRDSALFLDARKIMFVSGVTDSWSPPVGGQSTVGNQVGGNAIQFWGPASGPGISNFDVGYLYADTVARVVETDQGLNSANTGIVFDYVRYANARLSPAAKIDTAITYTDIAPIGAGGVGVTTANYQSTSGGVFGNPTGATSVPTTLPAGLVAGDLLMLVVVSANYDPNPTLAGWTLREKLNTGTQSSALWYRVATPGQAAPVIILAGPSFGSWNMYRYNGTLGSSPIDVSSVVGVIGANPAATATLTTVNGDRVVLIAVEHGASPTYTPESSPVVAISRSIYGPDAETNTMYVEDYAQSSLGSIALSVTAASSHYTIYQVAIKPVSSAPTNTVAPAVTGTTAVGSTLTSTDGTWDGAPTAFTRQWQRDTAGTGPMINILNATGSTYVLTDADDRCHLQCVVTAINASGSAAVASNVVGPVTEPAPTNSVAPTVYGSPIVGNVLTVILGTWAHMGGVSGVFTYQWKRETAVGSGTYTNISGATQPTYTVQTADIGLRIECAVTGTNDA